MVIRNGLTKIQLLMALAAALILCFGCGSDDESIVAPDTSMELDPSTEEPGSVTATGSLKGTIEKIDGVSVAIRVLQNGSTVASTTADANGNYQIDNIAPGTYTVEIVAKGYDAVEQIVQVSADGVVSLDRVTLKALEIPVSYIQGTLSDRQKGSPLNKVRVRLVDAAGNSHEVLTTQTGAFEFENVPADQRLTVIVDLEGFEKQEIAVDPIPAGETIPLEVAVVTLPAVRGLLLDQITKSPLIDVRVQLTDEAAGAVLETPTTTLGVFEFKGVSADQRLTITIDADKYEKQEFVVDPIPAGETVKLEVGLIPLTVQLPEGDGLTVGLKAPDFNLPDSDWEMIALADYIEKKKVVLVFDRGGGW